MKLNEVDNNVTGYKKQVIDLLSRTSEVTQASLTSKRDEKGKPVFDPNDIDNNIKWQAGYDMCKSLEEQDTVIRAFLTVLENKNSAPFPLSTKGIEDLLIHIIKDLGFQHNSNPFLKWIATMQKRTQLSRDDIVLINNLYADGTVKYEDVNNGRGLLYNPNLYSQSEYLTSDKENVIRDYYYVKQNHRLYNGNASDTGKYKATDDIIKNLILKALDKQEDFIVTETGKINTDLLRRYYTINRFINLHYRNNNTQDIKKPSPRGNDDEDEISNLSRDTINEINNLIKTKKIKFSDLKGILAYLNKQHDIGNFE